MKLEARARAARSTPSWSVTARAGAPGFICLICIFTGLQMGGFKFGVCGKSVIFGGFFKKKNIHLKISPLRVVCGLPFAPRWRVNIVVWSGRGGSEQWVGIKWAAVNHGSPCNVDSCAAAARL